MANLDALFNGEIFRKDHPIIIAQNRHLATISPVRLAYHASGYEAGRVLARNSVSGYYERYDNGASSGLDTATSVNLDAVDATDFPSATGTVLARAVFGGELYESKLTGLDANAKTDLGSRSLVLADGTTVLKF